jgi:hypothetical protein
MLWAGCSLVLGPLVQWLVEVRSVHGGELMGVYLLRNLLFLRVSLLEPNAITLYCLVLGSALTTSLFGPNVLAYYPVGFAA